MADIITAALEWDYTLTVAERELTYKQDVLRVILGYNHPGWDAALPRDAGPDLFAALAQFTTSYRSVSPLLPQLQVGARPTVDLSRLTEILAGLAEEVRDALVSSNGARDVAGGAPDSFSDTYDVEFLPARDLLGETKQTESYLIVYARTDSKSRPVIWPTINGQAREREVIPVTRHGLMEGIWEQAKYPCSTPGNGKLPQLGFTWEHLDIRERQTVRPQIRIFRNTGLAGNAPGMTTNPDLVYRTPLITGSRLVPLSGCGAGNGRAA